MWLLIAIWSLHGLDNFTDLRELLLTKTLSAQSININYVDNSMKLRELSEKKKKSNFVWNSKNKERCSCVRVHGRKKDEKKKVFQSHWPDFMFTLSHMWSAVNKKNL